MSNRFISLILSIFLIVNIQFAQEVNNQSLKDSKEINPILDSKFEILPILSYDSDAGFGYGTKIFFLNYLRSNESFDLVLFNSTQGERWYRVVFSIPDFELRQGKIYSLAFDLLIDYDKRINNSFFGVGNKSSFEDREHYTKEPFEINLTFSKGFSTYFIGQAGVRYKSIRNFHFSDDSRLINLSPKLNSATVRYVSIFTSWRYDTRNSFINPSYGLVLHSEIEYTPPSFLSNIAFTRFAYLTQYYTTFFLTDIILALRLGIQALSGSGLPVQVLLSIGGNNTLRGYPQDRYLDKSSAVFNAELRFPIFWRFGGLIGFDAGKVWSSIGAFDLNRWATNPTIGLRFYMDTFVVRADVGFGKETIGFYFNFGHLF